MLDKRLAPSAVISALRDGMTLGIGGWGPRRKPMTLVREILRSPLKDLTVAIESERLVNTGVLFPRPFITIGR